MYAPKLNILVNTRQQYDAVIHFVSDNHGIDAAEINRIYVEGESAWPYVMRDKPVKKSAYVLVRSVDELAFAREAGVNDIASDYGLYCMNSEAEAFLKEQGVSIITAPLELNERELHSLNVRDKELIVYGYIPLMVSAQCIKKNTDECLKIKADASADKRLLHITDRKNKTMTVECKCDYCYNLIYNSVPLSLLGIWDRVEKLTPQYVRLNFTFEDADEVCRVLTAYAAQKDPDGEYTRGHFNRGVE